MRLLLFVAYIEAPAVDLDVNRCLSMKFVRGFQIVAQFGDYFGLNAHFLCLLLDVVSR